MDARLPAHLEASSLIRLAESLGGFATVLARGERDGGTILVAILCRGGPARLYERMPALDGSRKFVATKSWIIEVDIDDPERFTAILP